MKGLLLLPLFLYASSGSACEVPPAEQHSPPEELIGRAKNVVLAQAIKAELSGPGEVLYTLQNTRSLTGSIPHTFEIVGSPAIWEGSNRNFANHFQIEFWLNQSGRVSYDSDCQVHPSFNVGGTYLISMDKPYHRKSFELIIRSGGRPETRDKWLQYVESRTGP